MSTSLDSSIRHLPFGEHLCLFFNSAIDRAPALLPVTESALRGRELLVLLAAEQDAEFMIQVWVQAGYDIAELRSQRRLIVVPPETVFGRRGRLDPAAGLRWFQEQLQAALLSGHEGLRIIHDTGWMARAGVASADLMDLEAGFNEAIGGTPITLFCHYNRHDFDSQTLLGVLKAHPKVVVGQRLCENDYYVAGRDVRDPHQELKSYLDRLQIRQRIREDLKSARDQFQALVEHVPAGILMIQPPEGRPRFMNSFAQSLLGRGLMSDATCQTLSERYQFWTKHGKLYPASELPVVRAMREKNVFRADDLVVRRPDGHIRHIEMLGSPIFDDFGELASAVAILVDISDRRQVEEQLLASERHYQQLLTSAGEAICVLNLNTMRFLTVNESFSKLLGYSYDDLRETSPYDLLLEQDAGLFDEWVSQILSQGNVAAEASLRCKDGRQVFAEVRFTLVEQDPEPLALAIINDITGRKELEGRLREYVRVEAEQRRQLEAILDTSPMGILLFDTNLITVAANPAAGRMFGVEDIKQYVAHPADQLIGQMTAASQTVPDLEVRVRQLSQDQSTVLANEAVEVSLGDPSFKRVLSTFTSPVRGDQDQFLGRVWIFSDLTEERRLQGQLWHAQKMESIGTLAGGVAHDFNNILVGVLGHASLAKALLAKVGKHQGRLLQCLEAIETAAERAAGLTRELLAYARGGKYRDVPIDVNRLMRDTLDILRPSLSSKVKVELDLQEDLVGVNGDPGQIHQVLLHQVLLNLCINASEAMPLGGTLYLKSRAVNLDGGKVSGFEGCTRSPQGN